MPASKMTIDGSNYIGAFAVSTDKFTFLANGVTKNKEDIIRKMLGTEIIKTTINSSPLVGLFVAANSNGVLLPSIMDRDEISAIKHASHGLRVEILDTDLNALRNNILSNDKIAIVNQGFSGRDVSIIKDVLGVEVVKMHIGEFNTVGANNILTNKGMVINNRVSEMEIEKVESVIGMKCEQSTANMGELAVGLATIANSHGLIVGDATSGFEYSRIAGALDIES